MRFIVPKEMTLLEALSLAWPQSSKTTLRSWIKQGRISVDGKRVKNGSLSLLSGQSVALSSKEQKIEAGLKILYEEKEIAVIYKPASLLSVSTHFEEEATAHAILKRKYKPKRVFVVHRLDQDTSGVMVFSLSSRMTEALKEIFSKHAIKRKYAAIVEGHLKEKKGTWSSYLFEDENYFVKETKDKEKGELAITHYEVIGESKNHSWLDITLETGKKNQIRVHCKSAGVPVAGDKKYGAKGNPLKRLCLHAYLLSFCHPITGKKMQFSSPFPHSFSRIIEPQKNFFLESKKGF